MMDHFFEKKQSHEEDDSRLMTIMMNRGHSSAAKWGLSHIAPSKSDRALDIGCGNGANLVRLIALCPEGAVAGIDRSEICVKKSRKAIGAAIHSGKCKAMQADASALPFEDNCFDLVTAFETIYFLPQLESAFCQIKRVLKPGGQFLICNETDGRKDEDERLAGNIPGMTIYDTGRLQCVLGNAGFSDICIAHEADKHWLCMTARKPNAEVVQ